MGGKLFYSITIIPRIGNRSHHFSTAAICIWVPVQVQLLASVAHTPIQLPANVPEKVVKVQVPSPCIHMGEAEEAPGSCLAPL